ncbi:hypothetical protein MKW92_033903, partial [Papaver armeniacum]
MLQRTRDNEGEVFEDFPDSKDYLQIHPGFEYMTNSKWQCSSSSYNEQSLPCADLGEGSKSIVEKGNIDRLSELPDALIHHIFSFLNIKYILQNCILSRRYRYLW